MKVAPSPALAKLGRDLARRFRDGEVAEGDLQAVADTLDMLADVCEQSDRFLEKLARVVKERQERVAWER